MLSSIGIVHASPRGNELPLCLMCEAAVQPRLPNRYTRPVFTLGPPYTRYSSSPSSHSLVVLVRLGLVAPVHVSCLVLSCLACWMGARHRSKLNAEQPKKSRMEVIEERIFSKSSFLFWQRSRDR